MTNNIEAKLSEFCNMQFLQTGDIINGIDNSSSFLECWKLCYLPSGYGLAISERISIQYSAKENPVTVLFPPKLECKLIHSQEERYYVIYFKNSNTVNHRKSMTETGAFSVTNLQVGVNDEVMCLINLLQGLPPERHARHRDGILAHLLMLTYDCSIKRFPDNCPKKIAEAYNYITQNAGEKISMEEVAKKFGLSYSAFRQNFKKYFGFSPGAYSKELRYQTAEILFRADYRPEDIAKKAGFASKNSLAVQMSKRKRKLLKKQ